MIAACPSTCLEARAFHDLVRADAESSNPETPHGRALRASAREWRDAGAMIGECLCGSSLMFGCLDE